jgi:hypothetical protein
VPSTASSIDVLYTVPPARFVEERNRLAAQLRKSGDAAASARVKAMTKPTVAVYATNQAARRAPEAIGDLIVAAKTLRKAQAGGAEARDRYREATDRQRRAIERLLTAAEEALGSAQLKSTADVLERTANNLRWGSLSSELTPLLEAGRLVQDVAPPGFELFANERIVPASVPARKAEPPRRPPVLRLVREEPDRRQPLIAALKKAKTDEARVRRDHEKSAKEKRRADEAVDALRAQLESAQSEASRAQRAYDRLLGELFRATAEVKRLTEALER